MTTTSQTIPCPICQTGIPFNTHLLLQGHQFACPNPNCEALVGIQADSVNVAKEAMEKLETLKREMKEKK